MSNDDLERERAELLAELDSVVEEIGWLQAELRVLTLTPRAPVAPWLAAAAALVIAATVWGVLA